MFKKIVLEILLVSSGANVYGAISGKPELHIAAEKGDVEKIRTLLEAGEDVNIEYHSSATDEYYTALDSLLLSEQYVHSCQTAERELMNEKRTAAIKFLIIHGGKALVESTQELYKRYRNDPEVIAGIAEQEAQKAEK